MAKSPKILFVDDDRDFLAAQTAFFSGRGFVVVTIDRVEGALARISEEKPDVIVLDLMMEHYDSGFVLSRKIRQDPALAEVPVIMLSGVASATGHKLAGDVASLKDWVKLDAFLDKPVTGRQLLKLIEDKLAGRPSIVAG
ncbi:MAG: response regulator [Polyangia bacterium]|jgi:twitching motility two-component system response regulator PilH